MEALRRELLECQAALKEKVDLLRVAELQFEVRLGSRVWDLHTRLENRIGRLLRIGVKRLWRSNRVTGNRYIFMTAACALLVMCQDCSDHATWICGASLLYPAAFTYLGRDSV